ncbi:MAG: hypothetical protein ACI9QC_000192 [Oceanicoccus sp.]|jgi:hypothetical protein
MEPTFELKSELWVWQGKAAWHFFTIDENTSKQIKAFQGVDKRRGWKSVRVEVKLGKSKWRTSIFPQKKETYILPVKAEIRKTNKLLAGSEVKFTIQLI